jgi:type IV secretory pathway VirB10-like protein
MPTRLTCFSCRTAFDAPTGAEGPLCNCPSCGALVANAETSVEVGAPNLRLGQLAGSMRDVRRDRRRPFRTAAIAFLLIGLILGCVFLFAASVGRFTQSSLASRPPAFAHIPTRPEAGDIFAGAATSQPSASMSSDQNRATAGPSAIAEVPDVIAAPPQAADSDAARADAVRAENDRLAQEAAREQARLNADQARKEQDARKRAEAEQKRIRDEAKKRDKETQQRAKAAAQQEKQRQKEVDRKARELAKRQEQQNKVKQEKMEKMLKQEVPDGSDPEQ